MSAHLLVVVATVVVREELLFTNYLIMDFSLVTATSMLSKYSSNCAMIMNCAAWALGMVMAVLALLKLLLRFPEARCLHYRAE